MLDTIKNIFFVFLLIQIIENIMPTDSYAKYIKFYGGLVIIVMLLNPLAGYFIEGFDINRIVNDIGNNIRNEELKHKLESNQVNIYDKIVKPYAAEIAEHVAEVVRAKELEMQACEVVFDLDENSRTFGQIRRLTVEVKSKYEGVAEVPEAMTVQIQQIINNLSGFYNLEAKNIYVNMKQV